MLEICQNYLFASFYMADKSAGGDCTVTRMGSVRELLLMYFLHPMIIRSFVLSVLWGGGAQWPVATSAMLNAGYKSKFK